MLPLSRLTLLQLRDLVNSDPEAWIRLRDAAYHALDRRVPNYNRTGRRFRAVARAPGIGMHGYSAFAPGAREFELRGVILPGRKRSLPGVYEVLAFASLELRTGELSADWQPIAYLTKDGLLAYDERHKLMMRRADAVRRGPPGVIDAGHANLLYRCRWQLNQMSQRDLAWALGAKSYRVVTNWESMRTRIPIDVWITLHKMLTEQNTTRSNPLAREIDAKILHPEDAQQYLVERPRSKATPLGSEELARRMQEARERQRAILEGARRPLDYLLDDIEQDGEQNSHGNGLDDGPLLPDTSDDTEDGANPSV